ncbi:MAG: NAD(P)-binding protein [Dermatophilaceae bacterium]
MARTARAFVVREPGVGEIREVEVPDPGPDDVLVHTIRSGISRGTETLVFRGGVPPEVADQMRAPFQVGHFPGPVTYGYLNVGRVLAGPPNLLGRTVFCLYPHQTTYAVPAASIVPVPDDVPPDRAVLAGTVETAVNALWDAAPLIGDRVAVVGGGMVGLAVARLLARIPGVAVTVVDTDPSRAGVAEVLGAGYATPQRAPRDCDLVVHASATGAGLRLALDLLAADASVLDLSWYGDTEVTLPLGGSFHARRLAIRASQVGAVALARRARRTTTDRLRLALELLRDSAFDALITGSSPFPELPGVMADLSAGRLAGLCHTITYDDPAPDDPALDDPTAHSPTPNHPTPVHPTPDHPTADDEE